MRKWAYLLIVFFFLVFNALFSTFTYRAAHGACTRGAGPCRRRHAPAASLAGSPAA